MTATPFTLEEEAAVRARLHPLSESQPARLLATLDAARAEAASTREKLLTERAALADAESGWAAARADLEMAQTKARNLERDIELLRVALSTDGEGYFPLSLREALRTGDEHACRAWARKVTAMIYGSPEGASAADLAELVEVREVLGGRRKTRDAQGRWSVTPGIGVVRGQAPALAEALFESRAALEASNDELRKSNEELSRRAQAAEAEVKRLTAPRFPILEAGFSVPWGLVAPFERQAQDNHRQTLERLAERGGLSASEVWCVVHGKHWRECSLTAEQAKAWARSWAGVDIDEVKRQRDEVRAIVEEVVDELSEDAEQPTQLRRPEGAIGDALVLLRAALERSKEGA